MKPGLRFAVWAFAMPAMSLRLSLLLLALGLGGCIHVKMDPIQVHATVDVNVKVDKALDDFFGDLDEKSTTLTPDPQD
jgi:hypothetical protein